MTLSVLSRCVARRGARYGHFLSTRLRPCSSYSCTRVRTGDTLIAIHVATELSLVLCVRMRVCVRLVCFLRTCLLIHICWKEPSEARIDPPIQELNLRSGEMFGAITRMR